MDVIECVCEKDDDTQCIEGRVYGLCSDECGGVCEYIGECQCTATTHKDGTHV